MVDIADSGTEEPLDPSASDSTDSQAPLPDASTTPDLDPNELQYALQQAKQTEAAPPVPTQQAAPQPGKVDPNIIDAQIGAESSGHANATGPYTDKAGGTAKGLMQLEDATGKEVHDKLGIKEPYDPYNPDQNKQIGTEYMQELLDKYKGDTRLALAAYNYGMGSLDKKMRAYGASNYEQVAAHLPAQTQDYVSKVTKDALKKNSPGQASALPDIDAISKSVKADYKGFADAGLQIMSNPDFQALPIQDQIVGIKKLYDSKGVWDAKTFDVLKTISTNYIDALPEDEKPNYKGLVGTPPKIENGEDPKKVLSDWSNNATQQLYRAGINLGFLGKQFDQYMADVSQNETDAFAKRNRSTLGLIGNRAINVTQDLAESAVGLVTQPLAAAVRLGSAGKQEQTAQTIEQTPEAIFNALMGKPSRDYIYRTDDNGYLIRKDGVPETHWQHEAAQAIGTIGAAIGTLGVGAAAGISKGVLAAANIGVNTLDMAGSSFKNVLSQTGDIGKAYTAAAFAIPAGVLGSIGEIGVVAGVLSPALKGLTKYDQARYLAQVLTKNAILGGLGTGLADATSQVGEISQTGQKFDVGRTGFAAATGAAGAALFGTPYELFGATRQFKAESIQRQAQVTKASEELASFRNGVGTTKVSTSSAEDFSPETQALTGITAEPQADGTTLLTKKTNIGLDGPYAAQDIPQLLKTIEDLPTPDDLAKVQTRQEQLLQKPVKTPEEVQELTGLTDALSKAREVEHINNIKKIEGHVAAILSQDPGVLPEVTWESDLKAWQNTETQKVFPFLKEALKSPEEAQTQYDHDLSDLSSVNIIDEEALNRAAITPEQIQAKQTELETHSSSLETLQLQHEAETQKLADLQQGNKKATKANASADKLQKKLDSFNEQLKSLPDTADLTPPTTAASEDAAAKRVALEKAKADLAEAKSVNYAKLNEKELKAVKASLASKSRKIQEIQAEILKGKEAVRKEAEAKSAFEEQQKVAAQREALTKKISEHESTIADLRQNSPTDVAEQTKKVAQLKNSLDTTQTVIESLKQQLKDAKVTSKLDVKQKALLDKAKARGLGARKGDTIAIPAGSSPEVKEQVMAHEVGHVVSDKVVLSPEAELAVNQRLLDLESKAVVSTVGQVADDIYLPSVRDAVKLPEDSKVSELKPKAKEALLSKRELLANQVGAIMLKRAGKDIGTYHIIPEVEASLAKTKLPDLAPKEEAVATPKVETPPTEPTSISKEPAPISQEAQSPSTPPEVPPAAPVISGKTGQEGETAFSKTVRENVPSFPATKYDKISRIQGNTEAAAYVEQRGTRQTLDDLGDPTAFQADPNSRIYLTNAIEEKATREFNENPTAQNRINKYEADQLRSKVGTSPAQQLAILSRFRDKKTFGDFISSIDRAYRDAGLDPPVYTDYLLKELELAYKQTQGLPDGVLRDSYTQKLFEKTLASKKISWPEFLSSYMRTNLLSGLGTPVVVSVSGGWMGPVVTALAHPIQGRGMIWRSMFAAHDVAAANAKRVLTGEAAYNLFGGMLDPSALQIRDYSTVPRAMASFFNRFGTGVSRVLGAIHSYERTLSGEGYLAARKYQELKTQYPNNPQKLTAEIGKFILSKDAKDAAIAQADKEGKALGINLSDSAKMSRAYEILRKNTFDETTLKDATDWTYATTHMGEAANPAQAFMRKLFNSPYLWDSSPIARGAKNIIEPFGRAMIALADYAQDFIPGNYLIDKGYRAIANRIQPGEIDPATGVRKNNFTRSRALEDRLVAGQKISIGISALLLGLSRSGLIRITGDEEKEIGADKGDRATGRKDFKEFAQTGDPAHSIIFKNGAAIEYKDLPGVNAIAYGLYHMNRALDAGEGLLAATKQFYSGAFSYAIPFLGGQTTLDSPAIKLVDDLLNPETDEKAMQKALTDFSVSAAKMVTPASSLLRDIQHVYDSTPEEAHQDFLTKMFKDIPGVAEAIGSKPALDRFGEPVQRTGLERIPGLGRVVTATKDPTDVVWDKLRDKGIIVPELPNTIKLTKSDYANPTAQTSYEATREERLGKAYGNIFTPEEWYQFVQATGPLVKRVAEQFADSGIPVAKAQQELIKRVNAIDAAAKKRYVRTGSFAP